MSDLHLATSTTKAFAAKLPPLLRITILTWYSFPAIFTMALRPGSMN